MVGRTVFYGYTDGFLYSRTFTGTTWGAAKKIDPYHDPVWANVDNNLGGTFNGAWPSLSSQMPNVTGMVYADGKLYYTLFGDSTLRWRWFSPDSGIVDERSNDVPSSVDFSDADGMFIDGGSLYYITKSDGNLHKVDFSDGTVSGGSPVVSGPIQDGVNWSNRALFLHGGEQVNVAPTALFSSDCTFLSCNFDGSTSSDPDGQIDSYAWDFGDGHTGTGVTPTHVYAGAGQHNVSLTVTDDDSSIHSVTHQVTVAKAPNQLPTARFTSSCTGMGCAFNGTTSSDPDGQVDSHAWDFGDGVTGIGVTPSPTYTNAGTYTVQLTVTDNDTATGSVAHQVTVPLVNNLAFVGASHSLAGSKKVKSAVVPIGVHAGDTMVLVFTRAPTATWTGPAGVTGWVQRDSFTNGAMVSTVWTKTAAAGDLGATVRMNSDTFALGALTLAAYSGADVTTAPTVVHRGDSSTATHLTLRLSPRAANGWCRSGLTSRRPRLRGQHRPE